MKSMNRRRCWNLLLSSLLFVSVVLGVYPVGEQSVYANWTGDQKQELTLEFSGQAEPRPYAVLNLFERKNDGSQTKNPVPEAEFTLYRGTSGTGTQIGEPVYTTDAKGRIVTEGLPIGKYYFIEIQPPTYWRYDHKDGAVVTEYAFEVTEEDVTNGVVIVEAYNVALTTQPSGGSAVTYPLVISGYKGATYSIGKDYKLSVWGDNSAGQLGLVTTNGSGSIQTTPVKIPSLVDVTFRQIILGYGNGRTVYGITSTGEVYAWGYGDSRGMLGTGDTSMIKTPAKVIDTEGNALKDVSKLQLGGSDKGETVFAVLDNGDIYSWGAGVTSGTSVGANSAKAQKIVNVGIVE